MVREPVEHGGGHLGVAEDLGPIGEGQVRGDEQGRVLVDPRTLGAPGLDEPVHAVVGAVICSSQLRMRQVLPIW
jgi:hypothetical protein